MGRNWVSRLLTVVLMVVCIELGVLISRTNQSQVPAQQEVSTTPPDSPPLTATQPPPPSETIPPNTPLATLTLSRTLIPPPTFEPPTLTPDAVVHAASLSYANATLRRLHSRLARRRNPNAQQHPGCEPDEDWQLTYTVQAGDAIASIAEKYGTYTSDLARANCISDPNVLSIGQVLRVPGAAHPVVPAVECVPFELMTPTNGTLSIPGDGSLTFNWRGPRAPRNLIRMHRPNGSTYEIVLEHGRTRRLT